VRALLSAKPPPVVLLLPPPPILADVFGIRQALLPPVRALISRFAHEMSGVKRLTGERRGGECARGEVLLIDEAPIPKAAHSFIADGVRAEPESN
jgi:hypothetical protein